MKLSDLTLKIFADGASLPEMSALYHRRDAPTIAGFTTNPSLMKAAGVRDYKQFATTVLAVIPDRPVSFEVTADEPDEIERQARQLALWGPNVYVKVPITDTQGMSLTPTINRLAHDGIKLNVTAVFTQAQVELACQALSPDVPAIVSIFAGRLADIGEDPALAMLNAVGDWLPAQTELLWASAREVYNVVQAQAAGCDIITLSPTLIAKLGLLGAYTPERYSLETVKQFHEDAERAGLSL
jgi:transaldolase